MPHPQTRQIFAKAESEPNFHFSTFGIYSAHPRKKARRPGFRMNENTLPQLPDELDIEKARLSNGMQVLLCRRPELHRTCILLNVASGCRDERAPGTAHMLEHIIFRGSRSYPSLRLLSQAFEDHGADFNAYTAREVTSFDVSMPAESFDPVVKILGEVLSEPRLNGIAAERDIIREEILADYDADKSLINVDDLLVSLFYGDAGHPIAGDPDDLARITKQEVVEFFSAHYAAPNMLIVIAGPLGETGRILQTLEDAFRPLRTDFRPWPRREMPGIYLKALESSPRPAPRLHVKRYDGATQSEILLGFLCPAPGWPGFAPIEMLVRVLDDGMASRLSRKLVEDLALVYDAEAFLSTTTETTLMQIRATCRHRRVPKVVEAIYDILGELAREEIAEDELARIKRRVVWEHTGLTDGMPQLAQWLSTMALQALPCDIRTRCSLLLGTTAAQIRECAQALLRTQPHITAIVGDITDKLAQDIRGVMQDRLGTDIGLTLK